MDYAEGRMKEVIRLTQTILRQEPHARRPMRLVLLARGAGEWWRELIDEKPEVHRMFHDGEAGIAAMALPEIDTGEQRLHFFRHCLDQFASILHSRDWTCQGCAGDVVNVNGSGMSRSSYRQGGH